MDVKQDLHSWQRLLGTYVCTVHTKTALYTNTKACTQHGYEILIFAHTSDTNHILLRAHASSPARF